MMDMWNDKSSFILWWELKVVPLSKGVVKPPNYTTPWGRNKGLLGIKLPGSLPGTENSKTSRKQPISFKGTGGWGRGA